MMRLLQELCWIAACVALAKGEYVIAIGFFAATWRIDVATGGTA